MDIRKYKGGLFLSDSQQCTAESTAIRNESKEKENEPVGGAMGKSPDTGEIMTASSYETWLRGKQDVVYWVLAFQFRVMKRFWGDDGHSCTTAQIHLMLLICSLNWP